ncbi:hypothetical protein Acr_22g0007070 [Actinidia rufa]|uniref:Uncharacterized protein n=1 Tax=Actinidia rufa TaxID=165716 RepID=A0A7J0GKG8_9ERIC|nr:hypothetical protein Acr_22g0007070 [Actinidia rufa]
MTRENEERALPAFPGWLSCVRLDRRVSFGFAFHRRSTVRSSVVTLPCCAREDHAGARTAVSGYEYAQLCGIALARDNGGGRGRRANSRDKSIVVCSYRTQGRTKICTGAAFMGPSDFRDIGFLKMKLL